MRLTDGGILRPMTSRKMRSMVVSLRGRRRRIATPFTANTTPKMPDARNVTKSPGVHFSALDADVLFLRVKLMWPPSVIAVWNHLAGRKLLVLKLIANRRRLFVNVQGTNLHV